MLPVLAFNIHQHDHISKDQKVSALKKNVALYKKKKNSQRLRACTVTSGGWWSCYNTLWSALFIQGFRMLHHCKLYMISIHVCITVINKHADIILCVEGKWRNFTPNETLAF